MAQLDTPEIPASTLLLAIAWLRWRIFRNGFIRRQTGPRKVGGLILTIVLRLLLWPIFAMMAIGPALGAGFFAWTAVSSHHPQGLAVMLALVAVLWQFVALNGVNMAAAMPSFDPASLLRFPLRFGRYLVLRLLLGLLTPSTIIGCLALLAAAIGITVADHSLAPAALLVLAVYAAMNVFLSRMIAAWMERWLSTRRAREIFGVTMALFFLSFQFFNYRRPVHHADPTNRWLLTMLRSSGHALDWLPPGFAAASILPGSPARLAQFAALLACAALFFVGFAVRLRKQFNGEYLSEGTPRTASVRSSTAASLPRAVASPVADSGSALLSPVLTACLRKEWMYLRGSGAQLAGLLTPLVFVFIFSRGMLAHHPSFLLSGAVGYALMAPMAALYNIFGADAEGVQLYLLAPVRLSDVVIAKNIASLGILVAESALAWSIVLAVADRPIPPPVQVSTAFWIVFVLFVNLALGTLRSIQAPRKVVPGQTRKLRAPAASRTSGLLVMATLFGSILLEIPVIYLCRSLHSPWLGALIFALLAGAGVVAYGLLLNNVDRLVLKHRDLFAEELCGD